MILGLTLDVEEVVMQREAPLHKCWRTVGTPHLLIMGHYEMGFVITPESNASLLRVHITYELPKGAWRLAGWVLGHLYARWCVRRMADDARLHFADVAS